jgi:iron(III) transport system ATP-binding protein
LYREPADAALGQFVGEAVLLPGMARNGRVTCALGTARNRGEHRDGPVHVLVRPEQIRLDGDADAVSARVLGVTFYGHDARVELALPDHDAGAPVFARVSGHQIPGLGTRVRLWLEGDVMAFPAAATEADAPAAAPAEVTGVAAPTNRQCMAAAAIARNGARP